MPKFEKLADQIVSEVDEAVRELQSKFEGVTRKAESRAQSVWRSRSRWRKSRTGRDFQAAAYRFRQVPTRISDIATNGSCVMRYLFAYGFKGLAIIQAFSGLICIAIALGTMGDSWQREELRVGLVLLVTAQAFWWIGYHLRKSADRKSSPRQSWAEDKLCLMMRSS